VSKTTRRRALALAATGLTGSLAGCASIVGGLEKSESAPETPVGTTKGNATETTTTGTREAESTADAPENTTADGPETLDPSDLEVTEPDVFSSAVPTPSEPSDHRYATMRARADAPTAAVYGNWKCPYTAAFARNLLPELVEEFVATGDVAVEFRPVAYEDGDPFLGPDAPRAARAGLAAWNVDPESYWQYFAYVFANQPSEDVAWAQSDVLARLATAAGVESVDRFEAALAGSTHRDAVREAAEQFRRLGADAVPRVVTDDGVSAPTVNPEATREQFRGLASDGD
jgi:protein-disulfide isomerase